MKKLQMERLDLFEMFDLVPKRIRQIFATLDENKCGYKELDRIQKLIIPLGYTFDYYLDAVPYNLRKIKSNQNE